MPIPDFQTIMLPLLRHLNDGKEHTNQETTEAMIREFHLTDTEVEQLLPSGKQTTFNNRVAWAKAHFKKAGVVEAPSRGVYRITDRGRELLQTKPTRIDLRLLDQYPGHREFHSAPTVKTVSTETEDSSNLTPEEHLAIGYQDLRETLAAELLTNVKDSPPDFFEQLVIDLLIAMGYGGSRQDAGRAVGKSGDGGIDGVINEDRLGLDAIYLQAKRWEGTVGRPEIQKFAGALQGQRARKGVFITTSSFTQEARSFVSNIESKIVLIDGAQLADLMIDYGVGVTTVETYLVKRMDSDYFVRE
jgi:restriction system protein